MPRLLCFLAILSLTALTGGCGGDASKPAKVSGYVKYKGKPLAKADVSFTPTEGATRAATGLTDDNGYYTLSTFAINDGALVGKYRVSISALGPGRPAKPGDLGSGMPGEMIPGDPVIPKKYFSPESSGLTFEVKPGSNRADFDLKD